MDPLIAAIILAVWAYIGVVLWLGPGLWFNEALVSGLFAGLVVGNIEVGLTVGGTLTLISLGQWTYGGATIPDYQTGSIVGTAIGAFTAAQSGDLSQGIAFGITVAITTALLMTQMDIVGRATTTVFIHGADRFAEQGNDRGVALMHILGQIPWGLTRFIPVFLAVWGGKALVDSLVSATPEWLITDMRVIAAMLPALGFAILLTMLPVRRYWPFLLIGFVLFAYFKLPIVGIALLALATVFLINMFQRQQARSETNV